jgi:hypothetical protein
MQQLESGQGRFRILLGVDTSALAAPYIMVSGREVLPIGGYPGGVPVPSLAAVRSDISHGAVRLFLLPIRPASPDPRLRWIEAHCAQLQATDPLRAVQYAYYHC